MVGCDASPVDEDMSTSPSLPLDDAGAFTMDAQRLVTGRGAIIGKSDSGKSNTATVIAEELLDLGIPIAVIDPEGEYVSLKEEYPVVHFADDPAADVTGGEEELCELAERAVAESIPVVADLTGWGEEEQMELAGAFASALYRAEHRYETPLLLFVDECHDFIPVRRVTPSSGPLVKVAKRGRKRGLGILGITQRPADVKSAFLTQSDWLGWHRLSWHNDMDQVKAHLDSEHTPAIPNLGTGEMLLDRGWTDDVGRVQVRRKRVTDLGATPAITRSVGSVPDTIPADIGKTTSSSTDESSEPADVIASYRVQAKDSDDGRVCVLDDKLVSWLDVGPGDSVAIQVTDDEVRLLPGSQGILTYTVHQTGSGVGVALGTPTMDVLDADAGDYVRGVEADDGMVLETFGDSDAPLLSRATPYTGKTDNDRANSVIFGVPVGRHLGLGLDDRVTVIEEDGNVYLVAGDQDGPSYGVSGTDGAVVTVGAKGCSLLDVREGHEVLVKPAGDRARLEVREVD